MIHDGVRITTLRRKVVLSNDSQLKGKDVYECDNVGEGEEIESERGKGTKDTEILKAEQRERHKQSFESGLVSVGQ